MNNHRLIQFHYGGNFDVKDGIKYYTGGKVEHCYNIYVMDICLGRLEGFVKDKLGYETFKMYWYKTGEVHDNTRFKLLWNGDSVSELAVYLTRKDSVNIYIEHYDIEGSDEGESEYEEEGETEDEDEEDSDVGVIEEENEDEGEDSVDDEEYHQIKKTEKLVKKSKKNPKQSSADGNECGDDDLNVPISSLIKKDNKGKDKGKDKGKEKVEWESEYESDSLKLNELDSTDSSDFEVSKEILPRKEKKQPPKKTYATFNPNTSMGNIIFEVGLIFTNVGMLKNAIVDYAVVQRRDVWFSKNDLQRVQARCRENCPWYIYASRMDNEGAFQVKSYNANHKCVLVNKHRCVRSEWLVRHHGGQIRANPRWKIREFQQHISEVHNMICSKNLCWLSKKLALSEIDAEVAKQYKRLYDYGAEVLRSNPNTTFKIKVDRPDINQLGTFQRMYICFGSLKEGFAQGCRKVIGLDGCFLKSYIRGELLSAVAKDGNDQMFPVAWAIVEVESTDSWTWFIKLLQQDLNLDNGHGYTIMTDQQKGLKHAIDEVLPRAEHRCCARHIYANWRKNHPGAVLKSLFWKSAKSCTVEEFSIHMEEIKKISPLAYEDLMRTESKYWSRAYFNTLSLSDMVDNNLSECFNSWIVEARYKPIIELLDEIRLQVMERLHKKRDFMANIECRICPRIIKKLNYSIDGTRFCKSTWTGGDDCEVRDVNGGQWVVNMVNKTCTCRRWDLSGIPCTHACQALFSMNINPKDRVDAIYSKETYMRAYQHMLRPMKGSMHWPQTGFHDILPPKERRMPGRPKKHRRKEQGEEGQSQKLSKKGVVMTCRLCLQAGHNKATCKASEEEISERQAEAAEAKRLQLEATKAAAALQRKRSGEPKRKPKVKKNNGDGEAVLGEPEVKRKRGRPPKEKNLQVHKKPVPAGVGVFTDPTDGHTYYSTTSTTINLSGSQPPHEEPSSPVP